MSTPANTPVPALPRALDPHGHGYIRLTPHRGSRRWCKKHKGKTYYFGSFADPQSAIDDYIARWPSIIAETPRARPSPTIADVFTAFLTDSDARVASGERGHRQHMVYVRLCRKLTAEFGGSTRVTRITPAAWSKIVHALYGDGSPVVRHNATVQIRTVLGWYERNHGVSIETGDALRAVPARIRRRHKRASGDKLLTPGQIRRLVKSCRAMHGEPHADPMLTEAALWLAINGGMRQSDIGQLTPAAYRRAGRVERGVRGWIDEARAKTESPRRFPLWPETADALDAAIASRPRHDDLLLTTPAGGPLYGPKTDRLIRRFDALRRRTWPNPESPHRSVSLTWFRSTHITVASTAPVSRPGIARVVRKLIAGHVIDGDVHDDYIVSLPDEPFLETVLHVRHWLLRR